jgi:hypothetical protein
MFSLVRNLPFLAPLIHTDITNTNSNNDPGLWLLLRQAAHSLPIHTRCARTASCRVFNPDQRCLAECEVLWNLFVYGRLFSDSRYHCMVRAVNKSLPGATAKFLLWRLGNNLAGQCKRSVGMALQIGIGTLSAVIAANIFRTPDGPRYILGRESLPTFSLPCRC